MLIEDLIARRLARHAAQRIATLEAERDAFGRQAQEQVDQFIRQVNERMIAYDAKIEELRLLASGDAQAAGNGVAHEGAAGESDAPGSG